NCSPGPWALDAARAERRSRFAAQAPARILQLRRAAHAAPATARVGELDPPEPIRRAVALGPAGGPALCGRHWGPRVVAVGKVERPRDPGRADHDPRPRRERQLEQADANDAAWLDSRRELDVLRRAAGQRDLVVEVRPRGIEGREPHLQPLAGPLRPEPR